MSFAEGAAGVEVDWLLYGPGGLLIGVLAPVVAGSGGASSLAPPENRLSFYCPERAEPGRARRLTRLGSRALRARAILYTSRLPSVTGVAVVWENGTANALTPLVEGAAAAAADVNDAGQIVGNSATTAQPWLIRDPVLWDAEGHILDLGTLGGSFGLATAVNAEGQTAGYLRDPAGETHAFLWEGGAGTPLDPLPGDTQSFALAINGGGEIVGISQSSDGPGRAVRWTQPGDATPPDLTVSVSPSVLWPPNHKYVTVKTAVAATDDTDPSPAIALVSVTSNEPDNAPGDADGNTTEDIVKNDDYTFDLRAERNETGSGRIYTITYRAVDARGNSTTRSVTVTVPAGM